MLRNWNNRRRITSSRIRVVFREKKGFDRKVNSQLEKKNGPSILLDFSYARVWVTWFHRTICVVFTFERRRPNEEIVAKVPLRVRQVGKLCVFARSDRHLDKNSAKFNYASRRIDIARYLFVPVF